MPPLAAFTGLFDSLWKKIYSKLVHISRGGWFGGTDGGDNGWEWMTAGKIKSKGRQSPLRNFLKDAARLM